MPTIQNQTNLQKIMETAVAKALEATADEVLKIFKRDYIWKYAYIKHPQMYERTGEFAEAWDFGKLKKQLMSLSKELWYNDSKVTTQPDPSSDHEPARYIHGSKYSSPTFVAATLPSILEGKQSRLWLSVPRKEKFWQKFIKDMIDGGELEKIIYKHFSANGFVKI